mmetsp:Transcript_7535/g.23412  ORF Transcript_7535/g.23412 Transcript_7535/m.23412 type:complete len:110 (+) Transcript_7535:123-452(+)|eukprot:scaffold97074_cov28-Tisochrysis_lutea.AAC.7
MSTCPRQRTSILIRFGLGVPLSDRGSCGNLLFMLELSPHLHSLPHFPRPRLASASQLPNAPNEEPGQQQHSKTRNHGPVKESRGGERRPPSIEVADELRAHNPPTREAA